jgi:regulatory protein
VAVRILGGAAQSAAGLERRLQRRGFSAEASARATVAMVTRGYVDDAALAQSIASRRQRTGHGRIHVAAELRARGVDGDSIAATLNDIDPDGERAAALELARRLWERAAHSQDDRDRRKRVAGALQRRGFDAETVGWVLRELARGT